MAEIVVLVPDWTALEVMNIYKAGAGLPARRLDSSMARAMNDQLYRNVVLSHAVELPVLGVMTRFATNSSSAMDAILANYGTWGSITGRTDIVTPSRAQVRIILHDGGDWGKATASFSYRVPDSTRMLVLAPGTYGVADTVRLESVGYTTEDLVSRPAEFAEGLLDPLTFFLLGALDRQPMHATGVMRRSCAVLLTGPSGIGKSTVTYAAHRQGYQLLGDEPLSVQLRPRLRVWGRRACVHVPPDARTHFPELAELPAMRFLSGKSKIVVESREAHPPRYADRVGVCLLRRGTGARPALERLSPAEVVRELTAGVEPGYDLYLHSLAARSARIADAGGWRLHVAGSPDEVVALLDDVMTAVERGVAAP